MEVNGILTPEQEAAGLKLVEVHDHSLMLNYSPDGIVIEEIAWFSREAPIEDGIRVVATAYLVYLREQGKVKT